MYLFLAVLGLRCCARASHCSGFSLLQSTGSRHVGFSSCGARASVVVAPGSRAQAQQLWRTGLVAPWHVGSSQTRDRAHVPCIGRQILNHCTTREVPLFIFCTSHYSSYFRQSNSTQLIFTHLLNFKRNLGKHSWCQKCLAPF